MADYEVSVRPIETKVPEELEKQLALEFKNAEKGGLAFKRTCKDKRLQLIEYAQGVLADEAGKKRFDGQSLSVGFGVQVYYQETIKDKITLPADLAEMKALVLRAIETDLLGAVTFNTRKILNPSPEAAELLKEMQHERRKSRIWAVRVTTKNSE